MKALILCSLALLASACATSKNSVSDSPVDAQVAKAQFEKLKALAGEWTGTGGDPDQTFPMEVRYRLTGGGNTVEETLFPGQSHEMVTMYHLDGDRLMLTHYCAAGNQPRMIARSTSGDAGSSTIRFDFIDATNLATNMVGHMHEAEITFDGADHIKSRWTFFQNGKPNHSANFDLKRKNASG
jgi:hypothetical protein